MTDLFDDFTIAPAKSQPSDFRAQPSAFETASEPPQVTPAVNPPPIQYEPPQQRPMAAHPPFPAPYPQPSGENLSQPTYDQPAVPHQESHLYPPPQHQQNIAQKNQPPLSPAPYVNQIQRPRNNKRVSSGKGFLVVSVLAVITSFFVGSVIPAYDAISNSISDMASYMETPVTSDSDEVVPASGSSSSPTSLLTTIWVAEQVSDKSVEGVDTSQLNESITTAKEVVNSESPEPSEMSRAELDLTLKMESVRLANRIIHIDSVAADSRIKLKDGYFSNASTREEDVKNMVSVLGGYDISVIFKDSPCDSAKTAGCVTSENPTVMTISPDILDKSYYNDSMLFSTIAHEYAHTVHLRTGFDRAFYNPNIASAFAGDAEHLADCMAEDITGVVFSTYGFSCGAEQLAAARLAWYRDF